MDFKIASWNIRSLNQEKKQKEVRNLIRDENLQVCAILETHTKAAHLNTVCGKVFGSWDWISNSNFSMNGCRIVVAWNNNRIQISPVIISRQSILCKIEERNGGLLLFCSFVYAANAGVERRVLWKELGVSKSICG